MIRETLAHLLAGSRWATARRDSGKPGRIALPDDQTELEWLVDRHLQGLPAALVFHAEGYKPWVQSVSKVVLSQYMPTADGRITCIGVDFDSTTHGPGGLLDPLAAARCFAERADNAGLGDGLLCNRSASGSGFHLRIVLAEPVSLPDACLGVGVLAGQAVRVAGEDADDGGRPNAFLCGNGEIAKPGTAGAFELFPPSDGRTDYGWPLTLPAAGAFRPIGGTIIDVFEGCPLELDRVPSVRPERFTAFVAEVRARLPKPRPAPTRPKYRGKRPIHPETQAFLAGRVDPGNRNRAAFAAACSLFGSGASVAEVEAAVLAGAAACGLPKSEALTAVRSAAKAVRA